MTCESPWTLASSPRLYDSIGMLYTKYRRPDPRIAAQIDAALGDARTICNVGAGTGAYEPGDRFVVPVEPSPVMAAQRTSRVVRAVAEALPFADDSFDAVTAFLTIHHWQDMLRGLAEMKRLAPRRVVFSFDLGVNLRFWLVQDYLPEIGSLAAQLPAIETVAAALGASRIETLRVPHDCSDGFLAAYWRRPSAYLDPEVRACISVLAQLDPAIVERGVGRLRRDLESGRWHERHGHLLQQDDADHGYRLIVSDA